MPAEFKRVKEIFLAAVDRVDPAGRAACLRSECGDDDVLRQQVEALLSRHDDAGDFLEPPAPKSFGTPDPQAETFPRNHSSTRNDAVGSYIGPYHLLVQLGEGGMGTVYLAEQEHPIKRRVALKVIKAGMDSAQVIARFAQERQALELMDHPHIARVLDAGMTDADRPYFVMELVEGVPVTTYCDRERLTPRERLELFIRVCQAVQHAHQKGVIHRDLKPSNVLIALVDGKPLPKVIDFGVAKATGRTLAERSLFTEAGVMVGTLEYMAPEQAELNNLDIDTRADVYSLGVLLYELLTGSLPFTAKQLRGVGFSEMLRMIKEVEPPKPSTRLSSCDELANIAAHRKLEPARLRKLVKGELDWIVMKCLEKDRGRRYQTANDLATDVQRYLADEPILAKPPTLLRRGRKWSRRHQAVVVTATVGLLAAVMVLAGSIGWILRDKGARRTATMREAEDALEEMKQHRQQARWLEALAAARRAEGSLTAGESDDDTRRLVSDLRADLEMVIKLEAIRNRKSEVRGDQTFDFGNADLTYAQAFQDYGIDIESLAPEDAAARIRARPVAAELTAALDDWASVRRLTPEVDEQFWRPLFAVARLADPDDLRNQLRTALESRDKNTLVQLAERDDVATLPPATVYLLAKALHDYRELELAIALLRKAQRLRPADFWMNYQLGYYLATIEPRQPEEAVRFYTAAVASRPQSVGAQVSLSHALRSKGAILEALAVAKEVVRLKPDYAEGYLCLGHALVGLKAPDEAITAYHEAIRLHPAYTNAFLYLGNAFLDKGALDEAIAAYQESIRLKPDYGLGHHGLGVSLQRAGKFEQSIGAYRNAIRFQPDNYQPYLQLSWLLVTCADLGLRDPAQAVELAKQAIARQPNTAQTQPSWNALGLAHYRLGDGKAAVAAFEKAVELGKGGDGLEWMLLALGHGQLGNKEEARKWYDRAVRWMDKHPQQTQELRHFRAEAVKLLDIDEEL